MGPEGDRAGGEMQEGGGTSGDVEEAMAVIAAVRVALGSSSDVYMQLL